MLKIVNRMSQLKFSELMNVYYETNLENGADLFSQFPVHVQIREAELDFYRYLNDVFFHIKGAFYAIWEVDDHYSAALRMEPYHDGWLLSGLETAPDSRRRGYATQLITSVTDYLLLSGAVRIYSHVSKDNRPSLSAHLKCGFQIVLDYAVYLDGSVHHNSYTLIYDAKESEA